MMDRRFEIRKRKILQEADIKQEVANGMLKRLKQFAQPFIASLGRREPKQNAHIYISGLLSDLGRKNVESIAYHYDQDRRALQRFIGFAPWDHQPLLEELARQIAAELGEDDGVIVFDPSAHKKCGNDSVGVQRQWLGRLGKVDNGQVAIYMGYASRKEHGLVDMLKNNGKYLPHSWIAGDDEMGRSSRFRRDLRALDEQYLLAVPSNSNVRDLDSFPPAYGGRGQRPKQPFQRVDVWHDSLSDDAWMRIDVRDGEKGPLVLEIVKRRVVARTERSWHDPTEELLIITRSADGNGKVKYDYYLSNAPADTPLEELARVVKAEHRIEDSLKRAKSEAGLSDYEVRTWAGWHHHQTLSLIATWFLILETRRGKKVYAGVDSSAGSRCVVLAVATSLRPQISRLGNAFCKTQKQTERVGSFLSL